MADDILQLELTYRQIHAFQSLIAKNLHALQGLLFVSCEMFQVLHDIDSSLPLLKRWHDLAGELL